MESNQPISCGVLPSEKEEMGKKRKAGKIEKKLRKRLYLFENGFEILFSNTFCLTLSSSCPGGVLNWLTTKEEEKS
jgi:hypothetical protein